ncbi:MAG TPA: type IV pilus assembly protein PilM, partial [Solirubrobacterales bacterium]|nr:type IV pilus assembly protein PilM [Solirubrobacterales bacterium]
RFREGVLSLTRQKKTGNVVGLDIEAGSIAATEVRSNGTVEVAGSAIGPLAPGAFHEGEVLDGDSLAESLKSLFAEHKLSKRVRLGVGNQRVVVRTLRLPAIEDRKELEAAIRFQAQEQMPMPLDQAVLEHQVVGGVAAEEGSAPQLDVVVVAARRDMVSSFLEPLRRAGLEPVGVDLSAFAMIRALADAAEAGAVEAADDGEIGQRPAGAVLYCNLADVTNLAVARGRSCLFTRVSYAGLEPIANRLASARGLDVETAMQWLGHVGLEQPVEEIEGDPETVAESRRSLEEGVSSLMDELRLSLDYYGAQEAAVPVERIVLAGPGSAIAGLAAQMESLGLPIAIARPSALAGFDDAAAARLTLPYGLALES